MTQLFAVIRSRGPAWRDDRAMEDQGEWAAHAAFMNGLVKDGFVLLGGPLEGTTDILLAVRADSAEAVEARLAADPWTEMDLLRLGRVAPWTLRMGALP
jgi:uncharacterized protein YciI